MNDNEKKALKVLANRYHTDGHYLYFRYIAEYSGLDLKQVRTAVRSLARKGLARFARGLFDDEGMVAGSGYCATPEGYKVHQEMSL